ncbi:MAG: hypothetical protein BGO08_10110 [Altererythrobacter sp. 66-12]|nr:MAG: hypothetical protein BGO08_10110 [Altererythrobacter sp. 66-12]
MSVDKGVEAYNAGQYDQAASLWNEPARQGNPAAQHNLGLLWRDGLGSTPKDLNRAAEWFLKSAQQGFPMAMVNLAKVQLDLNQPNPALTWLNMAARWNNAEAIEMLRQLGAPVPAPDLYQTQHQQLAARQQQLTVQQQQASQNLGQGLGLLTCALVGGGAGCGPEGAQIRANLPPPGYTTYRLRTQWWDAGKKMCQYADGSVLNVGNAACPSQVTGKR